VIIFDKVYNVKKKLIYLNGHYMDANSIKECIVGLKLKNRPQRVLADKVNGLISPITTLLDQWQVVKTILV
jgi:hypothetical protein